MRSNSTLIRRNSPRSNNASRFSKHLKRKYGGSIAEVIAFGERAAERMRKIEGRDAELDRLAAEIEKAREELNRLGRPCANCA